EPGQWQRCLHASVCERHRRRGKDFLGQILLVCGRRPPADEAVDVVEMTLIADREWIVHSYGLSQRSLGGNATDTPSQSPGGANRRRASKPGLASASARGRGRNDRALVA